MSEKSVVEILEGGLHYLRTYGWRRGNYGYREPGDTCPACALGALFAGAGVRSSPFPPFDGKNIQGALDLLEHELPPEAEGVVHYFNDHIAKRRRNVERLYERAIKKAKAA